MGTATRERTGRGTAHASGTSRRQRRGRRPGTEPAATSAGSAAPAAAVLRSASRTSRVSPLLRQLFLVEVALAAAAVGAALGGMWLVPGMVVAGVLVVIAVIRRRGTALQDWLSTALALRSRQRIWTPHAPDAEASLAPIAENVPGFAPFVYIDRERRTVGMLGDGTFLTAVVRVEASGEALRPAFGARALPLTLLGEALEVDDIVLESAQLVQQVRCAPAPHLPARSVARLSYAPSRSRPGLRRCG